MLNRSKIKKSVVRLLVKKNVCKALYDFSIVKVGGEALVSGGFRGVQGGHGPRPRAFLYDKKRAPQRRKKSMLGR